MSPRIVAITAGMTQPSSTRLLTDRMTQAIDRNVTRRGEAVAIETIELRDLAQDITSMLLSGFPSDQLTGVLDAVVSADGIVAVTPTFAGSYSGLFKSFMDLFDPVALADKPVLLGATAGTPRHSLMLEHAMRPLFAYLHADVVPTAVFAATGDFADPGLTGRIDKAADQFAARVLEQPGGTVSGLGPAASEAPTSVMGVGGTPDFATLLGDQLRR